MADRNPRHYPVGSPIRAQLEAEERAGDLSSAQQEVARAQQWRDQFRGEAAAITAQRKARESDPIGIRTRIADLFVTGLGKSLEAQMGFIYDAARSMLDGPGERTIIGSAKARVGQFVGGLIGPRGIGGSLIGMLPQGVRDVGFYSQEAYGATRREAMIEPLARGLSGRSPFGGLGNLSGFDDPNAANTLGRGAIYYTGLDSEEGAGKVISGGIDVLSSLFVDPAAVGGVAFKGARTAKGLKAGTAAIEEVGRVQKAVGAVRGLDDLSQAGQLVRAVDSQAATRILDDVERMSVSELTDAYFSGHPNGDALSTALKEATGPDGRKLVLKAMLGDAAAKAELGATHDTAAVVLENATRFLDETDQSISAYQAGTSSPPQTFASAATERVTTRPAATEALNVAAGTEERARRAVAVWDELDRVPQQTLVGKARTGEGAVAQRVGSRSDWYQSSPYARPIHAVFDRLPKPNVDLSLPQSAIEAKRMMNMARMPVERQDGWLARFAQEPSVAGRHQLFSMMEEASIRHMAEEAGIDLHDLDAMVAGANRGRASLRQSLSERSFASKGRDSVILDDGLGPVEHVHMPTGDPDKFFYLGDYNRVRSTLTKWGQFKAKYPGIAVPVNVLNDWQSLWRPAQIMKVGTSAVIQLDQQARIYAKLGALEQVGGLYRRGTRFARDLIDGVPAGERGIRLREFKGVDFEDPFGATPDDARLWKSRVSSSGSMDDLRGAELKVTQEGPRLADPKYRQIVPTASEHPKEWAKALNGQVRDDPLMRRLLQGQSPETVVSWAKSVEGRRVLARTPFRSPERQVEAAADIVNSITAGRDDIARLALDGQASPAKLAELIPDVAARPNINGLLLDQAGANSTINYHVQKIVDGFFRKLFSAPDDALSRNPFFESVYSAEMERRIGLSLDQGAKPSEAMLKQWAEQSRTLALKESKDTLYDLADQSRAAEILKFAVPFFEPVREGMTVWSELARQNPQRVARIYAMLRAPVRAGLVRDDRGYIIGEDGKHRDGNTGEVVPEDMWGSREMIALPLPGFLRDVPWVNKALGGTGNLSIDKNSIKIGYPREMGFGPIVQIPLNSIVKEKPELEESVKFVLRFGTTDLPAWKQALPATVRRLFQAQEGDDDRAYASQQNAAIIKKITDFRLDTGRVPDEDELRTMRAEAVDETRALWMLRTAVNWLSPVSIGFDSPYKPYADAYRTAQSVYAKDNMALQDENGDERSPDAWFADVYGDEYYALTQSMSRSMNGVPATIDTQAKAAQYKGMIQKYPELGGLVVGSDGAGEMNRTIYLQQLNSPVEPGSKTNMREVFDLVEASRQPQVREGWLKFTGYMDQLDAVRKARGLTSLNSKAASDLAAIKTAVVAKLTAQYPEWAVEYGKNDQNAWAHKIKGLQTIAADPGLAQRPEIQVLGQYLHYRDQVGQILATRKDKTLTAQSNADLVELWDTIVNTLKDRNLAFSDLANRYLDRDPVVL
jgi:hypothetical protein